ncbi:Ulp1-like peptidase [Cucumis melo var. makuwa]|uniref:Ulp1-like peptidase n=1 Tax=Cucumis melo var. makuwa TaxID=1194695 RepID=A0A5D3CKI9_CUCMM|nr:Ulp1-like peptidase [Cucumis melo var. makuwa]
MCLDVEEAFKEFNFTNNENAMKVALAFFIKTVMVWAYGKLSTTSIGAISNQADALEFGSGTFPNTCNMRSRRNENLVFGVPREHLGHAVRRSSRRISYLEILAKQRYDSSDSTGSSHPDCLSVTLGFTTDQHVLGEGKGRGKLASDREGSVTCHMGAQFCFRVYVSVF